MEITNDPPGRLGTDHRARPYGSATSIAGLTVIHLDLLHDGRGWQKTCFDQARNVELGLPASFAPTRWLANSNQKRGVTRGIHAEMCNKLVSSSRGQFWTVVVDLRAGPTFGMTEQIMLTPTSAVFIPIGCGNSYQTLSADAQYGYVADTVATPAAPRAAVSLADPTLAIRWPIPLGEAIVLDDDLHRPTLAEITPIDLSFLRIRD